MHRKTVFVFHQKALNIPRKQVHLDIEHRADLVVPNDRDLRSMRNDIGFKGITRYRIDGKTDTVDTDRPFAGDVTRIFRGYFHAQS